MALETKILTATELDQAVDLLTRGEVVAFPTETVYGLGANALDSQAVEKIFVVKGRPADNPLIVHLHSPEQLEPLVECVPEKAKMLMDRFWPGPLTLVLPKTERVPEIVSAGLSTVGVRIPVHPLALQLLERLPFPLAAPSANISGRPSPTRAEHVWADLKGRIPAILDGGPTGRGVESTVLDCTVEPFRLLRPGGVTLEELRQYVPVEAEDGEPQVPRSPGMKYSHYAPDAQVFLVVGGRSAEKINELSEQYLREGRRVGIMTWDERVELFPALVPLSMGPNGDLAHLAGQLYHLLREADRLGIDVLFVEGVSEQHLGLAIMNRLRKAAENRVIET
ncbi:MAG: threonylcarbamoyl-AMP synthase [Firmicutes bacterium]|nr:L-threonylcarbamoyladenylate synthase [Bacillota bacterium]NLO65151.1 threonylcarbamoyl-AMP synthase [Bacillota bacterium]